MKASNNARDEFLNMNAFILKKTTHHSSVGEIELIKLTKMVGKSTPTDLNSKRKQGFKMQSPNFKNLQLKGHIGKK